MSKIIGITPGPVEFTNLDNEDLATIKQFNPANTGSTGQVLTKTATGYDWETASSVPYALIYETTSFECPTNDNYQGSVPIDPEQRQAGSIFIEVECVAQTLNADSEVIASHSNAAYVTLSNNAGSMGGTFVGTTTNSVVIKIDGDDSGHFCTANFVVTLTPQNAQGTIVYDTRVEVNLFVPYSFTNDGAYTHRFVAGATAPTIISGCANAVF